MRHISTTRSRIICVSYTIYLVMQTEPLPRKLLDQVRDQIRIKHYSYRTEETYVQM
jgi:hypothetical protein